MSKSNQEKPKWFKGAWYKTGDTVTNSSTGEKVELSGPELSIYDFILGAELTIQMSPDQDDPLVDEWSELEMMVESILPPSESVDGVVFAVRHQVYRELDLRVWLAKGQPAVLDANDVLSVEQRKMVADSGCAFASIGRGQL